MFGELAPKPKNIFNTGFGLNYIQSSGSLFLGTALYTKNFQGVSQLDTYVTDSSAQSGVQSAYTTVDQYPLYQLLSYAHNQVYLSFDAYYDGNWESSTLTSNFQIAKEANRLQFRYSTGNTAGSSFTWSTAGYF